MEFTNVNNTKDMLAAASMFNADESAGQIIELPNQAIAPHTSSAVFAEPVIVAQPMQRNQRRSLPDFMNRMKVLAQMAGEDYRYAFPVKSKDGSKKTIEGGTIKMANDLVREYGNCMVDVRVIENSDSHVFYARFIDYETGFCLTRAFRQRKGQKTMKTDEERAADIVFQIGQSKAIRNVVLNALGTFADFAYEEAKNSLVEKVGKNLPAWRDKIAQGCQQYGYDLKRIESVITKPLSEWIATDIARVIAELKSISDGMTTFNDLYPSGKDNADALNDEFLKDKTEPVNNTRKSNTANDDLTKLNSLITRLSKTSKDQRTSLFTNENGQELFEKCGSTKELADKLGELGILVIEVDVA
jgi:hypothetical protein